MPSPSWSTLLDFLDQPAVAIRVAERDDPPGIEARGLSTVIPGDEGARRDEYSQRVSPTQSIVSTHWVRYPALQMDPAIILMKLAPCLRISRVAAITSDGPSSK
jgi:hypothetical protein